MKTNKNLRSSIVAIAVAAELVFSVCAIADAPSKLVGKDLGQHRDLVASVMRGRNYVVEVDLQGKIKQVVDTGANGDGTEAQESANVTPAANTPLTASSVELPENFQGQAAIDYMGLDLPKIAEEYGLTPDKLEETLLNDETVHIDSNNRIFYVDNTAINHVGIESSEAEATTASSATNSSTVPMASSATLANAFILHSNPGASKTIYLDFDGHNATNTAWSNSTLVASPYDLNGDTAVFDNNELSNIISIWNRVSEDYSPFDVDVTTEQPSTDALLRTSSSDNTFGIRVVITKSEVISCNCGGLAYVGVVSMINNAAFQPVWVFQQALANNEKNIAETVSHEAGHTLGLFHDGQHTGSTVKAYYSGHGAGVTAWAPIMGVGNNKNVTQWSSGAYPGANNQQDDIAVLASNGILPRTDLVGDTIATANALTSINIDGTKTFGIIETSTDVDMYAMNTTGGAVNLSVNPVAIGSNLDIQMTLYTSDGMVVTSSAPEAQLSASISATLPAGTYFLAVSGSGHAQAGTDYGYPTYGSLGQYQITGSYESANLAIAPTTAVTAPNLADPALPSVHVASIRMNVKKAGKVNARVSIKVVDAQGIAVANAVVEGAWSGALTGNLNAKAAKNGVVVKTSKSLRKGGSATFTVKNIVVPGYSYNSTQNAKSVATIAW